MEIRSLEVDGESFRNFNLDLDRTTRTNGRQRSLGVLAYAFWHYLAFNFDQLIQDFILSWIPHESAQ